MKTLFIISVVGFASLLVSGVDRQEVYECHQWEQQAKEFPAFYVTEWQAEQCAAHSITINAPIK